MYNVKTLNKIAACGTDLLDRSKYTVGDDIDNPQAILVRSASMHEMELGDDLLAIARAGAGVNNIPVDKCSEKGIVVFNTPGANANAVKELVILGLLISSRKVTAAIDWAKTLKGKGDEVGKLVEKGKSQFVGPEIKGKKLGVIGLGAIGALVANAAAELGMEVIGADPFLSVQGALNLSNKVKYVKSNKEIFETCDYITVHVPLTPETKDMINADVIKTMKKNNKIKKSVSVLAFLFVCAVSVILSSCSDELDIQQSYPFKVETMPVPKDIVRGQTVEIRCELKAEGKFDGTIYTIRYFQHDGKGSLRMENGTVFQPNDRYLLENEKFRLYYTSASTETQTLTVVVEDNFGKSYEMEFSFNDIDEEEEFARSANKLGSV